MACRTDQSDCFACGDRLHLLACSLLPLLEAGSVITNGTRSKYLFDCKRGMMSPPIVDCHSACEKPTAFYTSVADLGNQLATVLWGMAKYKARNCCASLANSIGRKLDASRNLPGAVFDRQTNIHFCAKLPEKAFGRIAQIYDRALSTAAFALLFAHFSAHSTSFAHAPLNSGEFRQFLLRLNFQCLSRCFGQR